MGPWATGEEGKHGKISDDHDIVYCQDRGSLSSSEIEPEPNMTQWLIKCEQSVLDQIEADPQYEIISSEEITPEQY